ncbi:hypothetical protein BD410DRAFT_779490 [Rickenella mellea]|uniref:ACB domain-containing protein n=1 Tax=Rickenella mellea TaxID=50990 RepID=A0A4R5XDN1_9AGAM|nr:hypothetical protein BD410DRAFT_779490 [Rickenella mellea]
MWDMLARAKWDAWSKHENMDSYEAKWHYVDSLLRVLRRYSDKTVARDFVRELESYGGDPSNMVLSGSFSRSRGSDSSASSTSPSPALAALRNPAYSQQQQQLLQQQAQEQRQMRQQIDPAETSSDDDGEDGDDEENDEDENENAAPIGALPNRSQTLNADIGRPQSSLSTQRYRTPMGGSLAMSPPPVQLSQSAYTFPYPQSQVPTVQPMPVFETPSAFQGPSSPPVSGSVSATPSSAFPHPPMYPANMYPGHPAYRPALTPSISHGQGQGSGELVPGARSPLERAVESVQAHLAALQERIETLEAGALGGTPFQSRSSLLPSRGTSLLRRSGNGGMLPIQPSTGFGLFDIDFDLEHMGMWSVVLQPLARLTRYLLRLLAFLSHRDTGLTPGMVILRRLLLDVSFFMCIAMLGRAAWRKSGVRRREVVYALKGLWGAVVGRSGTNSPVRVMVDRAV